jgi:hypothetical protein
VDADVSNWTGVDFLVVLSVSDMSGRWFLDGEINRGTNSDISRNLSIICDAN